VWDPTRRYGSVQPAGSEAWWSGAPGSPAGLPPLPAMTTGGGTSSAAASSSCSGSSRGG
jgi:hypothetical protein